MPPAHPGEVFREEVIVPNNLTITEVAAMLGVTRPSISHLVNEKAAMSPMMALRIAKVFGGTPDLWIMMQANYDLRVAKSQAKNLHLKPYKYEVA